MAGPCQGMPLRDYTMLQTWHKEFIVGRRGVEKGRGREVDM